MRRLVTFVALLPLACREPAHITVKLEMLCQDLMVQGIPQPQQCSEMQLECANFVEVRLYEATADHLGNILSTKCLPLSAFGDPKPRNLCDLQARQSTLIDSLPEGKTVRFRMRALLVEDERNGCNDDIPGQKLPVLVFDGFSAAVPIDGASHEANIQITTCGSCRYLPPACNDMSCQPFMCAPGQTPFAYPDGMDCCAIGCKDCDPATDPMCNMPTMGCDAGGNPGACPPPPMPCPDGQMPIRLAADCCLHCPMDPNNLPPMRTPDGGSQ